MRDHAGASIVSLFDRQALSRDPRLTRLEAYWSGLRGADQVPFRTDIDPSAVAGSLQFAFVLERVTPSVAQIRVAGMHLVDLARCEAKGMPFGQLFDPAARTEVARLLGRVFDRPARVHMTLSTDGAFGRREGAAELVLMPLRDDFGLVTSAFGGLISQSGGGSRPCRLSVREWRSHPVRPLAQVAEHDERATATAGRASIAGAAYLRVVANPEGHGTR